MARWKIMAGMGGLSAGCLAAVIAGPGMKTPTAMADRPAMQTVVVLDEPPLANPIAPTPPMTLPNVLLMETTKVLPPPVPDEGVVPTGGIETVDPAPVVALDAVKEENLSPESFRFPNPAPVVPLESTLTTKYRFTLHMGGSEPNLEIRSGDDIILKVHCEKVDVKSPTEPGQTLGTVHATGRVRFLGLASEGTCDELSFQAGTGDVGLSGNVTIQVKNRFGRTESELTGERMNYRLDTGSSTATSVQP